MVAAFVPCASPAKPEPLIVLAGPVVDFSKLDAVAVTPATG
jgi:hypothetical protein